MYLLYRTKKDGELALTVLLYLDSIQNIDTTILYSINTSRQSSQIKELFMGTVSALKRPMQRGVQVSSSGVTAKGVDSTVTNGCIFLTFVDETCLKAFTSGLDAKGVLYSITGLKVRFFIRNNH